MVWKFCGKAQFPHRIWEFVDAFFSIRFFIYAKLSDTLPETVRYKGINNFDVLLSVITCWNLFKNLYFFWYQDHWWNFCFDILILLLHHRTLCHYTLTQILPMTFLRLHNLRTLLFRLTTLGGISFWMTFLKILAGCDVIYCFLNFTIS